MKLRDIVNTVDAVEARADFDIIFSTRCDIKAYTEGCVRGQAVTDWEHKKIYIWVDALDDLVDGCQ